MKIGIHLGNNGPAASADSIAQLAAGAEALGLDSVWVSDHVTIPTAITSTYPYGPPGSFSPEQTQNFWEAFAVLAFVAGRDHPPGAWNVGHRRATALAIASREAVGDARCPLRWPLHPGSRGRLMREEFEALGFGEQFDRRGVALDEAIKIAGRVHSHRPLEYHGQAYDFAPVLMQPKPAQKVACPSGSGGMASARFAGLPNWAMVGSRSESLSRGVGGASRLPSGAVAAVRPGAKTP